MWIYILEKWDFYMHVIYKLIFGKNRIFYVNLFSFLVKWDLLLEFTFCFVVHFVLVYCAATNYGSRDLPIYL